MLGHFVAQWTERFLQTAEDRGSNSVIGKIYSTICNPYTAHGLWKDDSVTRFGEISPLWQKFTNLWQIFDGLFFTWQIADPTFSNL